jgi:PST family polysaccharide transporter
MSLLTKVVRAMRWSLAGRQVQQAATLIITAVLAKLLTPEDFGLIAMVTVLSGLAMLISDTGFSAAIIQNQRMTQEHYSTVFWVNAGMGTAVALAFYFAAPLVADFYQAPRLVAITQVLASTFFLAATITVPQALLRKAMRFKALSIIDTLSYLLAGVIVIVLALQGVGVWVLVIQVILQQIFKCLAIWLACRWHPQFLFSTVAFREVFSFSSNILGLKFLYYLSNNMDYLLIGRFLGAEALGYYTLAYRIMFIPIRSICHEINKVLFPAFSQIQQDKQRVIRAFLRTIKSVALIVMPMLLGIWCIAPEFVAVAFGEQWLPAVPILQILCIAGIFQAIPSASGMIFQSQGRPGLELLLNIVRVLLLFCVLMSSVAYGLVVFTSALTVFSALWIVVLFVCLKRLIDLSALQVLRSLLQPVLLSVLMALAVWLAREQLATFHLTRLQMMLALVTTGCLIYGAGILALWQFYRIKKLSFI